MAIDLVTQNNFNKLLNKTDKDLITIYFPSHEKGMEVNEDQDRLQFKNVVKNLENELKNKGYHENNIKVYLSPLHEMIDNRYFWHDQSKTLALFLSADSFQFFRLPIEIPESTYIGSNYYIKPLVPLFSENGDFYMLTLSKSQISLYQCTRFECSKIDIAEYAPVSIDEALQWDNPEESIQHHFGGGSSQAPVFHGQGVTKDDEDKNRMRFFEMVDKGLLDMLKERQLPMILVGSDKDIGLYSKISKYPGLKATAIKMDPSSRSVKELHSQAFEMVKSDLTYEKEKAIDRFEQLAGSDKTTTSTEKVIRAGYHKKIDSVFMVDDQFDIWGQYDPEQNDVKFHDTYEEGDEKLLNKTVINTLQNGGDVYLVKNEKRMDVENTLTAALLRF